MSSVRSDHYSGLLVTVLPGQLSSCSELLEKQPGVTVYLRDAERDRMIVVLEASSRHHLEELHLSVSSLSGVVAAEPVVHLVDDPLPESEPEKRSIRHGKETAC